MSVVTNFILLTDLDESGVAELNAFIKEKFKNVAWDESFVQVNTAFTNGKKAMEREIWIAASSNLHCDDEEIISKFYMINWENPEGVQLLVCRQDDDVFTVIVPEV